MARITVNNCLARVPNRFERRLLAAQLARQLHLGDPARGSVGDEPRAVTALREIAAGAVDSDQLREDVVYYLQRVRPEVETDAAGEEEILATMFLDAERAQIKSLAEQRHAREHDSDAA
jgi:DNA-directed RNA polymerase subunit omega